MRLVAIIIISSLFIVSCKNGNEPVRFSGQINNPTKEMVWITIGDTLLSTKLDENNQFNFELPIKEANKYRFEHDQWTYVFLQPGSVLHITIDTKDFDRSISYSGPDIEENEYLKKRILLKESLEDSRFEIPNMNNNEFDSVLGNTLGVWEMALLKLSSIESDGYTKFKKAELEEINNLNKLATDYFKSMVKLRPGNDAIDFKLIDKSGQEYSLKDFIGKIVCLDVWASWCTACIKEMPYFEKLADKYRSENVMFITISVDDEEDIWQKLLKERNIHGLQLWAKRGSQSDFFKNYQLNDLPVYIVIDKNGKIIQPRAPRPSENLEKVIVDALNK